MLITKLQILSLDFIFFPLPSSLKSSLSTFVFFPLPSRFPIKLCNRNSATNSYSKPPSKWKPNPNSRSPKLCAKLTSSSHLRSVLRLGSVFLYRPCLFESIDSAFFFFFNFQTNISLFLLAIRFSAAFHVASLATVLVG